MAKKAVPVPALDVAVKAYVVAGSKFTRSHWLLAAQAVDVDLDVLNSAIRRIAKDEGIPAKELGEGVYRHGKTAYNHLGTFLDKVPALQEFAPTTYVNIAKVSRLATVKTVKDARELLKDMPGLVAAHNQAQAQRTAARAAARKAKSATEKDAKDGVEPAKTATKAAAKAAPVSDTMTALLDRLHGIAVSFDLDIEEVLDRALDLVELSINRLELDDEDVVDEYNKGGSDK